MELEFDDILKKYNLNLTQDAKILLKSIYEIQLDFVETILENEPIEEFCKQFNF